MVRDSACQIIRVTWIYVVLVGGHLPKKIYVFLIMMKYDDLYFASRYNFFTDCVEWYFLPKTEIKVFLKKMDIRGFGWRPSIYIFSVILHD